MCIRDRVTSSLFKNSKSVSYIQLGFSDQLFATPMQFIITSSSFFPGLERM